MGTLARTYGVQTSFYDVDGRRQQASPQALLSVLGALGAPIESFAGVPGALRERRQQVWSRAVEPVIVAWRGKPASVDLGIPAREATGSVRCGLQLESGEEHEWSCDLDDLPVSESAEVGGVSYRRTKLALPDHLPCGYHRLRLERGARQFETLVISAPISAYLPNEGRSWGVLLPLYALRSRDNWGAGDLTDLERLTDWAAGLGGSIIATLPLLAAFLNEPPEPSPYAPVSRLFWNELYVDVSRIPELERCPSAQAVVGSAEFQREIERLRSQRLVDHGGLMRLKRRTLEELARCFFAKPSQRHAEFARFQEAQPLVEDYARFRATCERQRASWHHWPESAREGAVRPGDYDEEVQRYHQYAQWIAQEQVEALSRAARSKHVRLYLDLPLGSHPAGYDVWRERSLFARGVSAGAPPDTFFAGGQNWRIHPPNPESQRRQGYEHFIACLRHHLSQAGMLRIDHVMGLQRLYWIPNGFDAREGVYVRYPAEELYAILSLESHRHAAIIVGEDLGTVPRFVRKVMRRHGLQRSHVVQLDDTASPDRPLTPVPAASVASLNTHDTPPFAAYWRDLDESQKRSLVAFLTKAGLAEGRDAGSVMRSCLAYLAGSPARSVLVNLEDLWLETEPQNVPGTVDEYSNWRRKARHGLEELPEMSAVSDVLRQVDRLRKKKAGDVASK